MPIPDNIRARLEQLRMEAALRAEMERRQQQAQANAEAMAKKKATGGSVLPKEQHDENLNQFLNDSVVKDRMYHGTYQDFSSFADNPRGLHFVSPSPDWVYDFMSKDGGMPENAHIMPVHVSVKNPFDFENKKHVDALARKASLGKLAIDQIKQGRWSRIEDRTTMQAIKSLGHDGVFVKEDGVKNLAVFKPHQIKSATGNRGTYDPTNPDITKAEGGKVQPSIAQMKLAINKQGMYSPLEKAAMAVPRTKGTPAEFMAEISKQPGFRKDEVEDRKISLPEGKMTKEEFLGHLKKHPAPLLEERVLGGNDYQEDLDRAAQDIIGDDGVTFEDLYGNDRALAIGMVRDWNGGMSPEPKYENYALPGGDNYRELLLKKPMPGLNAKEKEQLMWLQAQARRGELSAHAQRIHDDLKSRDVPEQQIYRSNHWEDPNVLAHMRLSDRFVPNENGPYNVKVMQGRAFSNVKFPSREEAEQFAEVKRQGGYQTEVKPTTNKKILHVDEIQSDWHQQGRKEGYQDPEKMAKYYELEKRIQQLRDDFAHQRAPEDQIKAEMQNLRNQQSDIGHLGEDMVPDAPFKKNWHELALKHALGMAAKGGYHGIAITPGEKQADRYDLSKQVQEVIASPYTKDSYNIIVKDNNGKVHSIGEKSSSELPNVVGKELADKIVQSGGGNFSGLDLKVGGEGMKGFYDKIVPAYLNKLGKPHGAQVQLNGLPIETKPEKRIRQIAAPGLGHFPPDIIEPAQTQDLHYFPITQSMRDQIRNEGLPQYDKGGTVDPVEQMRQELAASGRGPVGMDAVKQNLQGAWQVIKDVPGNLKRLATDPVAYIRSLPSPTGEQIMNMAGPGNIGFAGMMIGPKARTWHTGRAQMAEAMEMARRTPEEIWQATGTIKGPDGIWRQEISDKGSTFNMIDDLKLKAQEYKDMIEARKSLLAPDKSGQKDFWPKAITEAKRPVREEIAGLKGDLSEMSKNPRTQGVAAEWTLDHPELYAAYPELSGLPVVQNYKIGPEKGSLNTAGGKLYNMEVNDPSMPRSIALHEMQHAIQNIEGMTPGANLNMAFSAPEYAPLLDRIRSNPEEFPQLNQIPRDVDKAAYEWYRRQHGEAEARATQKRQDMTNAERAQSFPYSSFDVNQSDLLTRDPIPYTGKVSEARGGSVHPLLPDFEE